MASFFSLARMTIDQIKKIGTALLSYLKEKTNPALGKGSWIQYQVCESASAILNSRCLRLGCNQIFHVRFGQPRHFVERRA
jgi:hypothetical protein